ncbi:MAG: lysophospholipid acyltransferase family protein [Gemmatimonadetes bacterium]|nr:lysophospholipid acyltransferase family protein [Gemmatimonadota bacterium]
MQVAIVWAFRICGTRFEVERAPEMKPHTSYLLIANHQSMFDVPIAGSLLFSNFPKYIAKRKLARGIPGISYNLRRGGHALIDRQDREQATKAIHALGVWAQARGVSPLIYPEGTRARRGELGSFKPSGSLSLMKAAPALPIVPFVVDGSWRLMRFDMLPIPFGTRIRVHIGAPIERHPDEDARALLDEVRETMERVLRRWRAA